MGSSTFHLKAGLWQMPREDLKAPVSWQSLGQAITLAILIVGGVVIQDRRLTTIEVQREAEKTAPLSEKQKALIHEEVKAFLQQLYKADGEEVETATPKKNPPKSKPKKPKLTGQLGPLRATEPLPAYAEHSMPREGDFKDGGE